MRSWTLVVAVCGVASGALASPMTLMHQARVLDASGAPVSGTRAVEMSLWTSSTSTLPADRLHVETFPTVQLSDGYLAVELGTVSTLDTAVFAHPEVWVQVALTPGGTMSRQRLATVPAAATAARIAPTTATCDGTNPDDAGLLRYDGGTFYGCTPWGWAVLGTLRPNSGDELAVAGTSCKTIHDLYPSITDGPRWVTGGQTTPVRVWCDMAGGGWTLIYSSQAVAGLGDRGGAASGLLASMTPAGSMLTVWLPFTTVSRTRFSCDGGKNGSIDYSLTDASGEAYARLAANSTGLENYTLALPGGVTLNNSNESSGNPDFWIYGSAVPPLWGTYDDYPYAANNWDSCNGVRYNTRAGAITESSTSNAYFYIWAL